MLRALKKLSKQCTFHISITKKNSIEKLISDLIESPEILIYRISVIALFYCQTKRSIRAALLEGIKILEVGELFVTPFVPYPTSYNSISNFTNQLCSLCFEQVLFVDVKSVMEKVCIDLFDQCGDAEKREDTIKKSLQARKAAVEVR